jgi:hypothetical protein
MSINTSINKPCSTVNQQNVFTYSEPKKANQLPQVKQQNVLTHSEPKKAVNALNQQVQNKAQPQIAQVGAQVQQNKAQLQPNLQNLQQLQQKVQQKPQPLHQPTGGMVPAKQDVWKVAVNNWITGVAQNKFDILPFHNTGAFSSIPLLEKQKNDDLWEINRLLNEKIITPNTYNESKQGIEKDFLKRVEDKLLHQIPIHKLLSEHYSKMVLAKDTYNDDLSLKIPCLLNVDSQNKSMLEQYGVLEITFLKQSGRIGHAFLKPVNNENYAKNKYGEATGAIIWQKLDQIYYNTGKVGQVTDSHEGLDFTVTYVAR